MSGMTAIGMKEEDELPLVMHDILELTGGAAIGLMLASTEGETAKLVYVEDDKTLEPPFAPETALRSIVQAVDWGNGQHIWYAAPVGQGSMALVIPIRPVAGHSRAAVVIIFAKMDEARRLIVEQAYSRRHATSVAYFRLWQVERLRRRRMASLEAALDLTQLGVLLIDEAGDIVFSNDAAEQIFAARDGLRRVGDSLRATDMSEGVRLQVALNHVIAINHDTDESAPREAATIVALHRKSGPPLILSLLAPQVAGIEPTDVAVIVFVVDPQRDTAAMLDPVCRLYQLSPVETQLVCHVAQGKTVSEASELMRIKEQTARSYMKQIFIKTDTNRQTELVVLMLSSVVRMKSGQAQKALGGAELFAPRSLLR